MSGAAPPVEVFTELPPAFEIRDQTPRPLLIIEADGRVFWHGHEVKSDAEFKSAMQELVAYFRNGCTEPKQ